MATELVASIATADVMKHVKRMAFNMVSVPLPEL
jgi:hypothetical protein